MVLKMKGNRTGVVKVQATSHKKTNGLKQESIKIKNVLCLICYLTVIKIKSLR